MVTQRRISSRQTAAITFERASRLYRLVTLLADKPLSRALLTRRLSVGVRDFYRDLEILRAAGVEVLYEDGKYSLATRLAQAQAAVPFPNPGFTLAEAEQLARGRTAIHRRLRAQVQALRAAAEGRRSKRAAAG
jgi:predicted DNA-binding transcriptional regulator YafY